jgi:hypothetical protein
MVGDNVKQKVMVLRKTPRQRYRDAQDALDVAERIYFA